jgi:hypothetical protein
MPPPAPLDVIGSTRSVDSPIAPAGSRSKVIRAT